MIEQFIIWIRWKFAWIWRIGLIDRTTAFRWEMDKALGERAENRQSVS